MNYDPAEYGDLWAATYDEMHAWKEPSASVEFLFRLSQGTRVLELGIGTGRLAIPLAERGIDIVGLDASREMVDRLHEKPGGEEIEVLPGDMVSADLHGPYGLVFVVFNTIFSLGDQRRQVDCFRNVRSAVGDGGRFVLECFVPDTLRFGDGNQTVRVLPTSRPGQLRLNASLHFPVEQRIDTYVVVIKEGRTEVLPVSLRYIWPSELDLIAELTGFELEARYGGWSEEPFTSESTNNVSVYRAVTRTGA